MKFKALNQLHAQHPDRRLLGLHPLLKKGGVHQEDDRGAQHRSARRHTRQHLRQTDWLVVIDD